MKIPLLVAIKHDVIVSLTVRWNVEFLVPYETIYRNLSTEKRKDIYKSKVHIQIFFLSISKIKPLVYADDDRRGYNLSPFRSYNEIAAVCPTSCGQAKVRCISF